MADQAVYIYALADPRTDEVRYVGSTKNPSRRLRQHLRPSQLLAHTHKNHWLLELQSLGLQPEFRVLREASSGSRGTVEAQTIWTYAQEGARLTNTWFIVPNTYGVVGERSGTSKLTEADVLEILRLHETGMTQQAIGRKFGVNQTHVGNIVRGESWVHLEGVIREQGIQRHPGYQQGDKHYAVKIPDASIQVIKELYAAGVRQDKLAAQFGVSRAHISGIICGKYRFLAPEPAGGFTRPDPLEHRARGDDHWTRKVGGVKRGEQSARALLTDGDARSIRAAHAAGERRCDLARRFDVTPQNIAAIVKRKTWKHVD